MSIRVEITPNEEKIATEYMAGRDLLEIGHIVYPDTMLSDYHLKSKVKKMLNKERVQAYIKKMTDDGDNDLNINASVIRNQMWQIATGKIKATPVQLKALQTLAKEFGVGVEKKEEENDYDKRLTVLHVYYEQMEAGLNPEVPSCLLENKSRTEDTEFELCEDDDD